MPLWLSNLLLVAAIVVIAYLIYRVFANKRWIRVYALTGFATAYVSLPALKLIIKAFGIDRKWGFDLEAAWGNSSFTIDLFAIAFLTYFFILENNYTKGESHQKYFHEFMTVVNDNIRDGISDTEIAKNRGIPLDKVQAIIICMAWLDSNQHKRRPENSNGN